ncbi:MAG: L,D-transpeptidase [Chitinophagaceae bacterium]
MTLVCKIFFALPVLLMGFLQIGCNLAKKQKALASFDYQTFRDSVRTETNRAGYDTTNVFDAMRFVPGEDSLEKFLHQLDSEWKKELAQLDTSRNELAFSNNRQAIAWNRKSIDEFLKSRKWIKKAGCREQECYLFAEIIKSKQILYLYIEGELIDSFAVSTGIRERETPNFSVRPTGPVFIKYTSKKFPGGNYQGLGNMPYAVFVKGGYAIHGTTQGNFSKLGRRASHGCIRLHPENAKLFNELVRKIGLQNTWVTVKDI